MKRQIRKGVYETNSSSTHAICITKKNVENNVIPNHIDFCIGEYGWEFEEYKDIYNKASYLITAILSFEKEYADEKLEQLKSILNSYGITYTLPDVKVQATEWDGKTCYYYDIDGYIDHIGELKPLLDDLLSDSDKLFRFLFGESLLITGNDNGDAYNDRMRIAEGTKDESWGSYTIYGDLKPEFDKYDIYETRN